MVKDHSDSERDETRCHHMGYSFRLAARVLLYAPSHRQDNTYHSLCYTSREHWLEREIAQWVHPMKDWSDDPSHHEQMLLPRSYISLLGMRNRAQWVHHEGSIRWPIAPWANALTTELHLTPSPGVKGVCVCYCFPSSHTPHKNKVLVSQCFCQTCQCTDVLLFSHNGAMLSQCQHLHVFVVSPRELHRFLLSV